MSFAFKGRAQIVLHGWRQNFLKKTQKVEILKIPEKKLKKWKSLFSKNSKKKTQKVKILKISEKNSKTLKINFQNLKNFFILEISKKYTFLKRVDTDRPIVFEQELDRRTFETVSIHYVINENIFRIFVTIFFINFFFSCSTSL